MIVYPQPEHVDTLLERHGRHYRGGEAGRSLMLSALASPQPVFGHEVYPTLAQKAAILISSMIKNHPLTDGNKRTAWQVTRAFLLINGYTLVSDSDSNVAFVEHVAAGQLNEESLVETTAWIETRMRPAAD